MAEACSSWKKCVQTLQKLVNQPADTALAAALLSVAENELTQCTEQASLHTVVTLVHKLQVCC